MVIFDFIVLVQVSEAHKDSGFRVGVGILKGLGDGFGMSPLTLNENLYVLNICYM